MWFLVKTIAVLTQHDRNIIRPGVNFEWSDKSWAHNFFRALEVVFGRKTGLRVEMSSGYVDGKPYQQAHTIEAGCALVETMIRQLFAYRLPYRVYVPMFRTPLLNIPASPYLFAVAFDVASQGEQTATQTATWSHTCTGSDLTLNVGGQTRKDGTVQVDTATYNSVSMTKIDNRFVTSDGGIDTGSLYLAGPATGANNIVLSSNEASSTNVTGLAVSITGTDSAPLGAHDKTTASSGTTGSQAITTTADNSMNVGFLFNGSGASAPTSSGTNQTSRYTFKSSQGDYVAIATQTTTTAGSYTISFSQPNSGWACLAWEIKEKTASVSHNLALLGVGT